MDKLLSKDISDLLFRVFFSSIFLALGAEHIFNDELIQKIMPLWVPMKRLSSIACGILVLSCGVGIFLGFRVKIAAAILAIFLITVSLIVHLPAVFQAPSFISPDSIWLWDIFQRSNLVKNLCLLGCCIQLLNHETGKYTIENYLKVYLRG